MILAVATESTHLKYLEHKCKEKYMKLDPSEPTRNIFAALLQSIWGISPTYFFLFPFISSTDFCSPQKIRHNHWNEEHNLVSDSYLWSLAQTPFGPYTTSPALSFSQRDSALRNVLYAKMEFLLTGMQSLILRISVVFSSPLLLFRQSNNFHFFERNTLPKRKNCFPMRRISSSFKGGTSLGSNLMRLPDLFRSTTLSPRTLFWKVQNMTSNQLRTW